MEITIRTTTYNREHLLPRTIESVLNQTFTDFQYYIINNGSTDNTQTIIDQYCEKDKRIIKIKFPFNSKDSAVMEERKKIVTEHVTTLTPYSMSIDDDDFMEPNTVETLYQLITEYKADISSVGSRYVYPDGTMKDKYVFDGIHVFSRLEAMKELLKREKFNAASGGKLFRRNIIEDNKIPNVKVTRDIYTRYRMINEINRMVVTGQPLFYFYRHGKNQSGLDSPEEITPEKMRQHLEANSMRTKWLSENMPEITDFAFYSELFFFGSLYERIHRLDVQPCFEIAKEMKTTLLRHSAFLSECGFCTEREKEILRTI